jgi:hypothetical protein
MLKFSKSYFFLKEPNFVCQKPRNLVERSGIFLFTVESSKG